MSRLACRRSLGRTATDLVLQLREVDEDVGLSAQLVSNHWRLSGDTRCECDADSVTLHRFDQRAEITIRGNTMIRFGRVVISLIPWSIDRHLTVCALKLLKIGALSLAYPQVMVLSACTEL